MDVAIVTGGLGPTLDDVTAEAAARAAGTTLRLNENALLSIEGYFKNKGRDMTRSDRKQAMLPEKSKCLPNDMGTAPGFVMKINKCLSFFLPGVPQEAENFLKHDVIPRLAEMNNRTALFQKQATLSVFGLPEASVSEKSAKFEV